MYRHDWYAPAAVLIEIDLMHGIFFFFKLYAYNG